MSTVFPEPERVATYEHPGILYAVALDPTRRRLYAGSFDHGLYVFDLGKEKKEPAARWSGHGNYVSSVASFVSAGEPRLVSGSYDRRLVWWNTETGEVEFSVDAHEGWIRAIAPFPDGERLVSVGDDMRVKVWDAESGRLIHSLEGHASLTPQGHVNALYAASVSHDQRTIASADRSGEVRVWEADSGRLAQTFRVPELYTYDPRQRKRSIGGIRAIAFSLDDGLIAAGGSGQVGNVDGFGGPSHVELWDWRRCERLVATGASGHKGILQDLAFHPSGLWLCAAGGGADDGVIAFWDAVELKGAGLKRGSGDEKKSEKDSTAVPAHRVKTGGHVQQICMNEDGSELYAAGYQKLEVWRVGKFASF